MPRATKSAAETVIEYFRKAPMENATLVMDLSRAALRERQEASAKAKAAQKKAQADRAGGQPAGQTAAAGKPAGKKRTRKDRKAAAAAVVGTDQPGGDLPLAGEAQEPVEEFRQPVAAD